MKKRKWLFRILWIVAILALLFVSGPRPDTITFDAKLPFITIPAVELEKKIAERESKIANIKPGNQSRILWYDTLKKSKTPYVIVYLHGFSASGEEGNPVATDVATKYGFNLYMPRLYAHGLDEKEPLLSFNEKDYLNSAKQAVAEAFNLGEKVIIMGTSTGCTLALIIASANPDISGLILYSPNIDLFDSRSFVLTLPWGLQIARTINGGNYYAFAAPPEAEKYWNTKYRIEALIKLKNMVNITMSKQTFSQVKQPVLVCYYYKNEKQQDDVVSVPALLKMVEELGTEKALKRKVAIPEAGVHALASGIWGKDIGSVEKASISFLDEVLKVKALK